MASSTNRRPNVSDVNAGKTPSAISKRARRSTSETATTTSPRGTLVRLTGNETDEELEALAEEIFNILGFRSGPSKPPSPK
jgi:hypothetical protein